MPRRVLHATETTLGGVGRFLAALVRHQVAGGDGVTVAAPAGGPGPGRLLDAGAEHRAWKARPRPGPALAGEMAALARIVRDVDPDLVHLHSSKAGMAGRLLLRRRRPTVFQPHAWSFFAATGPVQKATLTWERVAARWADVILCVSDDERRVAERVGVRAELRVLPNGVDLERFPAPTPEQRAAARRELGLGKAPLAVCLGRLHRQKNQRQLLDVWPAVRAEVPDAILALVGDGPHREELEERAVVGVELVGATDDVRAWLTAASLVVQPSKWEGMSLSVLEALACARSVVVTDVPGMREVIVDGVGAVVPPEDPGALTEQIVARLRDPDLADAEGRAGRARVEAHHDLRVQLHSIAALYDEVLTHRERADL